MAKVKVLKGQLPLFDDAAHFADENVLSRRQIEEQIIRKQTELEHGEMDYLRHLPSKKALRAASLTKHSNRAKVDGVWMDVRMCKYLYNFLENWTRRKSQLAWEIDELQRLLK